MKKRKMLIAALVLTAGLSGTTQAATVVTDTNVTLGSPGLFGSDYSLTLCHENVGGNCGTALWFDKTNKFGWYVGLNGDAYGNYSTLSPVTWTVDIEADYYLVPYGTEFSTATISSGQFSPLFTLDHAYSLDVPFGSFYLGIATGGDFDPLKRDTFGWVQLNNSSNGLVMIGNAMAYGTAGIYVGTSNTVPVPEPETYAMMLAGLGLVGAAARRQRG